MRGPEPEPSAYAGGAGPDGQHVIDLADGSTAMGHVIALGIGRTPNVSEIGLEAKHPVILSLR